MALHTKPLFSMTPAEVQADLARSLDEGSVRAAVRRIIQTFHSAAPQNVHGAADELAYGEIGLVTLSLERPIVHEPFSCNNALGTFVLARRGNIGGAGTLPA